MIVRCTRKLGAELEVRHQDLEPAPVNPATFEDWHANLVRIDRRKCLLLVDSKTLFTFLVPGVLRRDLAPFGELLTTHLAEALFAHLVELNNVPVLLTRSPVVFAPTNSRKVLGSMNEYAFLFKRHIDCAGGLQGIDLRALHRRMNETPMRMLGHDTAIDRVRNEFA